MLDASLTRLCIECRGVFPPSHSHRKYCSSRCKRKWRLKNGPKEFVTHHACRICSTVFPLHKGQSNKWLCSPVCRRASVAKSVREFHKRRPYAEAVYRARTAEKRLPDSNLVRFYRNNPNAPKACESCNEHRVLDVAHKPKHRRLGAGRSQLNNKWPEMVWVLCPTCHALLDRMHYSPSDLRLNK